MTHWHSRGRFGFKLTVHDRPPIFNGSPIATQSEIFGGSRLEAEGRLGAARTATFPAGTPLPRSRREPKPGPVPVGEWGDGRIQYKLSVGPTMG